jgi:hypothetical protein
VFQTDALLLLLLHALLVLTQSGSCLRAKPRH